MKKNLKESDIGFISYVGNYAITHSNMQIDNYLSYKSKKTTINKQKKIVSKKGYQVMYFEE